ncbi:MAG TPA: methyltransferase domain-containing protein [Polyangia bacterium]|nr:methyltransferase domain-containing protein [Polyangia bacterium]
MGLTDEQRARTLARFEAHRRAWGENAALRALYADWYGRIAAALPAPALGPRVELGSGPGFARSFIPDLQLTDIVQAPWHDREVSADALPFAERSLGALVLFDVLHHLPQPRRFFHEAVRVLVPGGRIVMCEPHVSLLSYPVYKLFHEEPLDLSVDPLDPAGAVEGRDPFDSNQAIPSLLFGRDAARFAAELPELRLLRLERLSGLSYPASGGFSRRPLLPQGLWSALHRLESRLPPAAFRVLGFRLLAVVERA